MELKTAGARATGSKTIADMLPLAVQRFGDQPAQRFKVGEDWKDVSYAELGEVQTDLRTKVADAQKKNDPTVPALQKQLGVQFTAAIFEMVHGASTGTRKSAHYWGGMVAGEQF